MGLPDPNDVAAYDDLYARISVGTNRPLTGPIVISDYDPRWPELYEQQAARVRGALGDRVMRLEHLGSTSVPELAAKPVIDVVLEVADSADEPAYVSDLEAAGYGLKLREPDWHEHRLFKTPDEGVNLHVWSAGCTETERMVRFRDWLRSSAADRELYARTKRELAAREWKYRQQYADAKDAVVAEIMARAEAPTGAS